MINLQLIAVYPHNGILLSKKKERTTNTHNNMDESQKHTEQKKPDTRGHTAWFHLHKILEQAKLTYADRKPISGPLGLGLETEYTRELYGLMEMFCLDCGDNYTSIYICQNSSNSWNECILLYVNHPSGSWFQKQLVHI